MNRIETMQLPQKKTLPLPYLSGLAHFMIELCISALPVFYPLLIAMMALSYQQIGVAVFVISIAATLTQPLFGYLSDRVDRRMFMVFSVAWVGILFGLVALLPSYWFMVLILGLGALGSAAFHPTGAALATSGSRLQPGTAAAVFSVSGSFGSALAPLLFGLAIGWLGMRASLLMIPAALLMTLFLAVQYRAYGETVYRAPSKPDEREQAALVKEGSIAILVATIIIVGARSWVLGGVVTYLPEWLLSMGFSAEAAGAYLSILMISSSVGTLTGGMLSDRVGRLPVVVFSLLTIGPTVWMALNLSGPVQAAMFGLVGFCLGLTFPTTLVMGQDAWPQGVGLASSMVMGIGWLPFGIGSWMVGRMADQTTLTAALGTLVYIPLVGLAAAAAIAIIQTRKKRAVEKQ
jgi:MFS transporter, FSR family, fosmidomycin resistance protein